MKVVKWTEWDDEHNDDIESWHEIEEMSEVVAKELREKGYHFNGSYHQNGEYGVPVLDNGKYFQVTQRTWGGIMAEAFPEEFDNPDDPYNYVIWYLGPTEKDKYIFPKVGDYE